MSEEFFTDDMIRHGVLTVQTQAGIIKYAEAMAQVLAEAGKASEKATGDDRFYVARKWSDVILARTLEILRATDSSPTRKKLRQGL